MPLSCQLLAPCLGGQDMENLHLPSVCSLFMVSMHSYEHVLYSPALLSVAD
jgi:hypothetical protein